jgi:SHS2 domain-containing protein
MAYKFIPHTADIKIHVEAPTIEKAFTDSALALQESILGQKLKIKQTKEKLIKIKGHDLERLLYEFMEEFIYLIETKNFILSKVNKIEIENRNGKIELNATISGDNSENYKFSNNVKAITYNDMLIKQNKSKTTIEFVIDV